MGIHSMFFHGNAQIQGILTLILVVLGIECKKGATYAHVLVILWASDRLIYSVMPKTVVADFATTHLKYLLIITKLHRQNKEKLYNFGLAFQ